MFKPSISDRETVDACSQISIERNNESKYLTLEAYFSKYNLDGFKKLMRSQADGENGHAHLIIDFLDDRNANYYVETLAFKAPPLVTIGEVLDFWLTTEQNTTLELIARQTLANEVDDMIAWEFWQTMIKEQREEEKMVMYWYTRATELGVLDIDLSVEGATDYTTRLALITLDNEAKS